MCGIAGILNYRTGAPVEKPLLRQMAQTMVHRGPDDEGVYAEDEIGLAFRRLAIIDLSPTGHQPMSTADGRVWIIFNGEIYNFQELRSDLVRQGYQFRGRSDTEVLVNAYHCYGASFLEKLNGMFAIALWDRKEHCLLLARDRMGKKPLYVADDGTRLIFASEMKAIFSVPDFRADVDVEAIDEYFAFGYVSGDRTVYKQVKQVVPGQYLRVTGHSTETSPYWRITPKTAVPDDEHDAVEEVAALLDDAVRIRMVSEVPLGAYLSGGIDSSLVVATMVKFSTAPVKTFSIGFTESDFDETHEARVVANYLGTEHHEEIVTPDYVSLIHAILADFDQPFGDSSALPTYIVSKLTRRYITVVLSGDGGDEVFGGYRLYDIGLNEQRFDRIPPVLKRFLRTVSTVYPEYLRGGNMLRRASRPGLAERYVDRFQLMNEHERNRLIAKSFRGGIASADVMEKRVSLFRGLGEGEPLRLMQHFDMLSYLPDDILVKVDRMSMLNSLETRSPFLDHRLVGFGLGLGKDVKLQRGLGKYVLRSLTSARLPAEVARRPKRGFAVPLAKWFRHELKSYAQDMVFSRAMKECGMVDLDYARRLFAIHQAGWRDMSAPLWLLIAFATWLETSSSWRRGKPAEGHP